jgi:predicted TIM-barrel fold metal-dependent hydrolase
MSVDCHAHVFDPSLPLASDRRYTPSHGATLEQYLSLLDANGIAHGVLTAPSFLGTDNGQLSGPRTAACAARSPWIPRSVATNSTAWRPPVSSASG